MDIAKNKKAYFEYELLEKFEAGVQLTGDEIKSLRKKQVSLADAFATFTRGELFLLNCYIAPYTHAYEKTDVSRRSRKLLLNKRELNTLVGAVSKKGLTIVPLRIFINSRGYAKVEIALARHKKLVDKRKTIQDREQKRQAEREVKVRIK
ncbi:MAG: SsrA-binding protein SmpB [Epsilonproteobacteria bacterium]|nr:SsrA-binding protein SmpB [Campylobacterota bacterium]